jgi:serine/threonine-protein kinase
VSEKAKESSPPRPVQVIERIPVAGNHGISAADIERGKIPVPVHLILYPEIGRGGMGHVHPATDRHLLRHVALKRLDPSLASEAFYRDGFIAEAQIAGQLEHPNILPVYELALDGRGIPYFTMKLVQGRGFDGWLHEHPVGTPERMIEGCDIILKVADAVAYAHHRGVIHRDLKPGNVMVAGFGQVYLMDWGLARLTITQPASGEMSQMNAKGAVGTADYMSPEQARGIPQEMDERADVFGLGAMLYELVTGKRPYGEDDDPDAIIARAAKGEVIPIEKAAGNIGVPKRMAAIVSRALRAKPDDRYPSATAFAADLRAFMRGGLHLPSRTFKAGTRIMNEGDAGDEAYMIVAGHCRATRSVDGKEESLAVMGPGEVFGEMALLLDEPRAASVEAMDQVTVQVLDRQTMTEGLGLEGWTGALVVALASRFRKLEEQVRQSGLRRG